jgi:tetratricopeptide (TPR) repeat protein
MFMRLRRVITTLILLLSTLGIAQTLVVYPLSGQDVLLGFAVSDQLTEAFQSELTVYGPLVSPALIPPLVAETGFISLTGFIDQLEADGLGSRIGTTILREIYGSDYALSGNIRFENERLLATFYLASAEGIITFQTTAPEDDPTLLASKAAAVLAARLGTARPVYAYDINLSGSYAELVRAIALLSGGFLSQANDILRALDPADEPRAEALLADVEAAQLGQEGQSASLMATLSLSISPLDETRAIAAFERLRDTLPVADTWIATLYASANRDAEARAAFDVLDYPYGVAARISYDAATEAEADLSPLLSSSEISSLLTVSLIANFQEDLASERAALESLTRIAPTFVYPFERLSFIGFDTDDALLAAETLSVAVRLEPESDLYWTNLGWAYYLLGLLDASERASVRAIELDAAQFIAYYNLGLVRTVTGRLSEAMSAYDNALALDPLVDDEAVVDLENALELFPDEPGVHFALGTLYAQQGRRSAAAEQFELFITRSSEEPFVSQAAARIESLNAPLPPIEISRGARLGLGSAVIDASPYRPGDRVVPVFEIYTPGDELPARATVELRLRRDDTTISEQSIDIELPRNAIGYLIDTLGIDIPAGAGDGSYALDISVSATEERSASTTLEFNVAGTPLYTRQLISRNVVMRALDTDAPLYANRDVTRSDNALLESLLQELRVTAPAAEEALPEITSGRFAGLTGGQLFLNSSEGDVTDFLDFLLASGTRDANFSFVDAYAQWALDGAPTE